MTAIPNGDEAEEPEELDKPKPDDDADDDAAALAKPCNPSPQKKDVANPLTSDPELRSALLSHRQHIGVDSYRGQRQYARWKVRFLGSFETFLSECGMLHAARELQGLADLLDGFLRDRAAAVRAHAAAGDLGDDSRRPTVRALRALAELDRELRLVSQAVRDLVPMTAAAERAAGFSKFEMGAVLIRGGFSQYVALRAVEDELTHVEGTPGTHMDGPRMALFAGYRDTLRSFCDIMASLGLYDVMMTCAAIAGLPPVAVHITVEDEEEEEEEEDDGRNPVVLQWELKDEMAMSLWALKERLVGDCGIAPARQAICHHVRAGDDDATVTVVPWEDNEKLLDEYYEDVLRGDDKPRALHLSVGPFRFPVTVLLTMMGDDTRDDSDALPANVVHCQVDPTKPLSYLQRRLERASGIPAHNQRLVLRKAGAGEDDVRETTGRPLIADSGGDVPVEDLGITAGDVLEMEPRALRVTMRLRGLSRDDDDDGEVVATLSVAPADDAESVREKLLAALREPGSNADGVARLTTAHLRLLTLEREGEEWPVPGQTVRESRVNGRGCDIAVGGALPTLAVTVQTSKLMGLDRNTDHAEIQVHPLDTLLDIKRRLDCGHHLVEQLRLFQDGEALVEEDVAVAVDVDVNTNADANADADDAVTTQALTAIELGIKAGAVLLVEPTAVPLSVRLRNDDGEDSTLAISVAPSDTAAEIKARIEEAGGFGAGHQPAMVLTMDGEEWQGTVRDKFDGGLKDAFSIDVALPKLTVTVEAPMLTIRNDDENAQPIRHGEIQIYPTDTVRDIKRRLDNGKHPVEQLRLYHNGDELAEGDTPANFDDTGAATATAMTASELGIETGAILLVEPTTVPITVRLRNDDGEDATLTIAATPSDTAEEIKTRIVEASGDQILVARKPMMMLSTGEEEWQGALRDNYAVSDGVTHAPRIDVALLKLEVMVQSLMLNTGSDEDNSARTIKVDSVNTLGELKRQLERLYDGSLSADHMALYLNDGPVEMQNDSFQIGELGIAAGSELRVEPSTVTIHVRNNTISDNAESLTTTLEDVRPGDSTATLLQRVPKTGGRHCLVFGSTNISSNPLLLMKDVRGLRDGAHLFVELAKIRIVVKTPMHGASDAAVKLVVDPTKDTLGDLKRMLEEESGEVADNQNLYLAGEELVDDANAAAMTVADHGITAGSILTMEPRIIHFHVTMPDGERHTISVRPRDTLVTVKCAIEVQSGIAAARQILFSHGEDAALVKNTLIRDGAEVCVTLHRIPIVVNSVADSAVLDLNVEPSCTVDELKGMISEGLGWRTVDDRRATPSQVCLVFAGRELMDGEDTLENCGVMPQATLTTELLTDHIIFVDIKCGTLFAAERIVAITKGVLTPVKVVYNKEDDMTFVESVGSDPEKRMMILKKMKDSSTLGVATRVVVTGTEIDDYKLNADVASKWGVQLKPRGKKDKNKEELIFVVRQLVNKTIELQT